MATIKIILWKTYKKKNNTYPIAIRITQNRKPRYIFTGHYILEKDWDKVLCKAKRTHPNAKRLNNYLLTKLVEVEKIALESETSKDHISSKDIQKKAKRQNRTVSFFQFGARRVKSKYLQERYSVAKPEFSILHNIHEYLTHKKSDPKQAIIDGIKQCRKERIGKSRAQGYNFLNEVKNEFSQNTSLYFEDINEAFLSKFKVFCTTYLGQKTRTVTNQLIFIRTLYNAAIKEGIVDMKHYPFGGEKEKIRLGSGHKIGLTKHEIERIENLELEKDTTIWHTKNIWLVAFYFAGIRISDVVQLKWADFKDGRLLYIMNKNEKPVSLKTPDKASIILKHYKPSKSLGTDYIFPFLKKANPNNPQDIFVKTRNASSLLNKYLKRIATMCAIEKPLSNHIARHSFGNIAGDKIHPLMLQKLYRHSDLKTTLNYQANFIHKDADDALDEVLDF